MIVKLKDGQKVTINKQVPTINVRPIRLELDTYYPTNKDFPIGHSELTVEDYHDNGDPMLLEISKYPDENDYNLISNNCSDATRCALEKLTGKKMNPFLFTTPGDTLDFFRKNFDVKKDKNIKERLHNRYYTNISKLQLEDLKAMPSVYYYFGKGSKIYIKKKNRGKFTAYCGGNVTSACIAKAKASGNPTLVKRATFAANARKWKHQEGGTIKPPIPFPYNPMEYSEAPYPNGLEVHKEMLEQTLKTGQTPWIRHKTFKEYDSLGRLLYGKNEPEFIDNFLGGGTLDKISDIYQRFSDNIAASTAYDLLNAGLYMAAPFTGGTTLIPAMIMTGLQAGGATANAYKKGLNVLNGLDIASAIPGFGLTEKAVKASMKPVMKMVGKTTKKISRATKYKPIDEKILVTTDNRHTFNFGKYRPTYFQMAMLDKKYAPYAALVYGEDALNHGLNTYQVVKDVKQHRKGGKLCLIPRN